MKTVDDEFEDVLRKFGDEQSTLLDRFERLSFEVQLNKAMLGRSVSEPGFLARSHSVHQATTVPQIMTSQHQQVQQQTHKERSRRLSFSFNTTVKKLLKSIIGRRGPRKHAQDPNKPTFSKPFSRSLLQAFQQITKTMMSVLQD